MIVLPCAVWACRSYYTQSDIIDSLTFRLWHRLSYMEDQTDFDEDDVDLGMTEEGESLMSVLMLPVCLLLGVALAAVVTSWWFT